MIKIFHCYYNLINKQPKLYKMYQIKIVFILNNGSESWMTIFKL